MPMRLKFIYPPQPKSTACGDYKNTILPTTRTDHHRFQRLKNDSMLRILRDPFRLRSPALKHKKWERGETLAHFGFLTHAIGRGIPRGCIGKPDADSAGRFSVLHIEERH